MAEFSDSTEGINVRYVARLARLTLTDAEAAEFQTQLEQIMGYVKQLGEADIDGIEPMAHAIDITNVFRADEPRPSLDRADVIANFPETAQNLVKVPKIIDG